ncbi:SGNH/GDSL hydrolase family protein [Orrella sp. JC864]|uniref:SGNH/GDSL hydrolase family protein n=1 Tax=Orrella sp. JC864 TaxID=3120298 RepID=UPI00300A05E6
MLGSLARTLPAALGALLLGAAALAAAAPAGQEPDMPAGYVPGRPYAVVVGDSIAEGEPALKGRLNHFGQFKGDLPSSPGQLSYELAARYGVFHFNHGMGGQTSGQVRARWPRDVLAQELEVGDGRPGRTLPAGTLPVTVYLHVGINDLVHGISLDELKANFTYFAHSTAQARIALVVDNIGAYLGMTDQNIAVARDFNRWLAQDLARRYPNVTVIDYLDWSSGGTGDYRHLAPGLFADGVHPSPAGYASLADYVQQRLAEMSR